MARERLGLRPVSGWRVPGPGPSVFRACPWRRLVASWPREQIQCQCRLRVAGKECLPVGLSLQLLSGQQPEPCGRTAWGAFTVPPSHPREASFVSEEEGRSSFPWGGEGRGSDSAGARWPKMKG